MFQIIFGLIILFGLFALVKAVTQTPPNRRNKVLGFSALGLFCVVLILLVLSGRLHVLVAIGAALIPLLKQLPRLLPYLPTLKNAYKKSREKDQGRQAGAGKTSSLSREEACLVLGLSDHPSKADVIEAHRRLIQKVHPDRGGSDYLAARINEAKDVLMRQFEGAG